MKLTFTLTFIFLFAFLVSSQRRYDVKFKLDGFDRECIIVKPSTAPPAGGYPVVFMLHGTSGDGEKFYNISGWKELGEQENFITVFPSSLSWCFVEDGIEKNNTKWVCGDLLDKPCAGPPQNYVDDIRFLKRIVAIINDTVPMNPSKIFACGFSNGCCMINKLAMDAGNLFAAVAGSSAALNELDSVIPPVKRIPIWIMVGTLDDRFLVPPFTELPFGRDSILGYLKAIMLRTLACQGLSQNFTYSETTLSHTYTFNESENGGTSNAPFVFTLNKDQTHEFPNGINYPVNAPKLFWDFFNQSTTVAVQNERNTNDDVVLYPNPSRDLITIGFQKDKAIQPCRIRIVNSFGQIIKQFANVRTSELTIQKNGIGSGLFTLLLESGSQTVSKKIIFF